MSDSDTPDNVGIRGVHTMFYSDEAQALREFLRDKLGLDHADLGGGWLAFRFAAADLGVHPTGHEGAPPSGTHDVSFTTDDLDGTVARMRARGVVFDDEVTDLRYGRTIHFTMPGGVRCELFQPARRPSASEGGA